MATHDLQGRPYARLSQLKPGDVVIVDAYFTCMLGWSEKTVYEFGGDLTISCDEEHHTLDGSLDYDDNDTLIGIYRKGDA